MNKLSQIRFVVLLLGLPLCSVSPGAAQRLAVGGQAGTQGIGAHLVAKLADHAHLRLTGGRISLGTTISTDEVDYDADARFGSVLAILDWYPAAGSFRISAGAGWNGNEVTVSAPLLDLARAEIPSLPPIDLDLGTVSGTANGSSLAPVLLFGWGNPFSGGSLSVSFDLGVLYQGEPSVTLRADTPLPIDQIPGGSAVLAELLAAQELELEAELEGYTLLPVVVLQVSYRF